MPVFCGVGGSLTGGARTLAVAPDADFQGAHAMVLNAPAPHTFVEARKRHEEVPVIVTVASTRDDVRGRVAAGADILNVAGRPGTPELVRRVRDLAPKTPVFATGAPPETTIGAVIDAGAHAVAFTPPTPAELFRAITARYRTSGRATEPVGALPNQWARHRTSV